MNLCGLGGGDVDLRGEGDSWGGGCFLMNVCGLGGGGVIPIKCPPELGGC